ncbi:SpoIIE family protein phosphatase [Streptomyces sp. SYSU K21746]
MAERATTGKPAGRGERAGAWWDVRPVALVETDSSGRILQWAMGAPELLGYTADQVVGRASLDLVPASERSTVRALQNAVASGHSVTGVFPVRSKDGSTVELEAWLSPLAGASGEAGEGWGLLALAVDARQARRARGAGALLEGLFARSPIGLAVFDTDVRFLRVNPALAAMNGVPAPAHIGRRMTEVLPGVNGEQAEAAMRRVLATGEPVMNFRRIGRTPADPDHDRVWSTSYYRLDDSSGRPVGVSAWIIDATRDYEGDLDSAPGLRRLELLNETSLRVGTTLDVARTGQELCDLAVPRLADVATVDVLEPVSQGGETLSGLSGGTAMRRLGKSPSHGSAVAALLTPVGGVLHFPSAAPYAQALIDRRPFLLPRIDARVIAPAAAHTQTPEKLRQAGVHSLMMAPLMARGLVLGIVTFLRAGDSPAFDRRDVALAQDMAAHAALCIDNARLYNREHDTALTLQRSMLPPHPSPPAGIEIAHRYRPASDVNEVGGDWYDMTTLAPGEVALVIGDVMGHGIQAAAVMGQLRTTARALARLDVPPNLLLHQLDTTLLELDDPLTATCLYAVCDAATGSCRIARAGHPPPVLITPDGATRLVDLPTGAPLGIGGIRYSTTSLSLEPGSTLVFYTDGLVEARGTDLDERLDELTKLVEGPDRDVDELCDTLLSELAPATAEDDIAILVARIGTAEHCYDGDDVSGMPGG